MLLQEKSILEYIDEVDSPSPIPGGGSVAALVGTLGVSLARMLAHFSVEKKKFTQASKLAQDKFILAFKELDHCKDILLNGIDSDALSYLAVLDAYRSKDQEAIEQALVSSTFVAYELQDASVAALSHLEKLIQLGNKMVLSDLISGAILLQACCEMCALNVTANASSLKNEEVKKYYLDLSEKAVTDAKKMKNKILKKINS